MHPYETPITDSNLDKVFRYSRRKHYWIAKKSVIRSAVLTVGQLLFFLTFFILAYGVLYDLSEGLMKSFIERLPALTEAWGRFSDFLFAGAEGTKRLTPMLLFLYGVPAAGSLLCALLVVLLYHPSAPKVSKDPAQKPRDLWVLSQHISKFQDPKKNSTFSFCSLLFGLIAVGFLICYLLYFKTDPAIHAQLQANLGQASLYMVIGWAIGVAAYGIFNLPLRLLLFLLYFCPVPKDYYRDVDTYYRSVRLGDSQTQEEAPET